MTRLSSFATVILFVCCNSIQAEDKPAAVAVELLNKVENLELPDNFSVPFDEGFITVKAKCDGPVEWIVLSNAAKVKHKVNPALKEVDVSVPPQECVIIVYCYGVIGGKLTKSARTDITVTGAPMPNPSPNPTPQPVPTGKLHATVVEDASKRTPEIAKVLTSTTLRQKLTEAGIVFRVYDQRDPLLKRKNFDSLLSKLGGLPVLIIQSSDGKVISAGPMPRSEEEFLKIIGK